MNFSFPALQGFISHGHFICLLQGVNPWIEVDGGVGPANAYKVHIITFPPKQQLLLHEFLKQVFDCHRGCRSLRLELML